MTKIQMSRDYRTSYENFIAMCPYCGKESIFNRASDLHTYKPISGCDVSCLNVDCGKAFRIIGDTINNAHEMIVYDCYELIDKKHYMNSILNLAQAYEVFFSLYFRVELAYKPFGVNLDQEDIVNKFKRVSNELHKKIKEHTFNRLRSLFLYYIVKIKAPNNLTDSMAIIKRLPAYPKIPNDEDIKSIGDADLIKLLIALKNTEINQLRNKIVHKQAYRPTLEEVEKFLKETRFILFKLTNHLKLYDDVNLYMNKL